MNRSNQTTPSRGGPRGGRGGGGRNSGRGSHPGRGGGSRDGNQERGGNGRGGGYQERGGRGHGGRGDGGRRGGGGRSGGGRDQAPDMKDLKSVLSNVILADVSEHFQFFLYSVQIEDAKNEQIESRHRRRFLFDLGFWDGLLSDMPVKEKDDLRRVVFFQGSYFCSARKIEALDPSKLPLSLPLSEKAEGDSIKVCQALHYVTPSEMQAGASLTRDGNVSFDKRCADCTKCFKDVGGLIQHCQQAGHKPVYAPSDGDASTEPIPASIEVFVSYINVALQRALGERLARWGMDYIDPLNMTEPVDRNGTSLGVRVYEAFSCQFGIVRPTLRDKPRIGLTVDLRAKILRTMSVLDHLVGDQNPNDYKPTHQEQERARRHWIGEIVISMHDKRCYTVTNLLFDQTAAKLMVEGRGISHAEYFSKRKGVELKYPNASPMIAVLGRGNQTIHLPPELVAGNDLDARVKQQLPMIASYKPEQRNRAIDKIRSYLIPGAQKSKGVGGLLPALGIQLADGRLGAKAQVLPLPMMMAAGVQVPASKGDNWTPMLNQASFKINPKESNTLQVVVFYNEKIRGAINVYTKIRDLVNNYNATYRFSDQPVEFISAGDRERHWGAVEKCFSNKSLKPENIFVLDFNKPKPGSPDSAYPVIKQILTKSGYLSQFVNFNTYSHDNPRDLRRSSIILQGVARQILQKAGVRLWWVKIPPSLPTPSVFVGVDVFHAPRVYDPVAKKRGSKASCAAIIVQIFRKPGDQPPHVELYSRTYARQPGKEYELADALKETISTAMRELGVTPKSCIVWRDGIGDSAFSNAAVEEINGIRRGLNPTAAASTDVPMAYIVAQKRIATKFLSKGITGEPDGKFGAPSGTLVQGIQGLDFYTFYINGRAPPYSTPKPVRFVVIEKDDKLNAVPLEELTWQLCHDYANWCGPIKVPSVTQMAHKLAELGGSFPDCGSTINASKLRNKIHFL